MVIQGHQFWYNRKLLCDFLLVNNTNLILSRGLRIFADFLVKFLLSTGTKVRLFSRVALVRCETLNSRLRNLASRSEKHRSVVVQIVFRYFKPFRLGSRVWIRPTSCSDLYQGEPSRNWGRGVSHITKPPPCTVKRKWAICIQKIFRYINL